MTLAAFLRHLGFAALLMLLSAATVRMMIAVRVMDTPEARKAHDRPIPKGGGVGIVLTFLVGIAVLYRFAEFTRLADPYFRGVIEASVAIALVAFLDDLFDWPFIVKLGAQLLAALVAIGSGLYVTDFRIPYLGPLPAAWVGIAATMVWLLFTTNAMNFIDGLNGLASGVALIACLFIVDHRRAPWRLVRVCRGRAAGDGTCRIPAVQLSPSPHLHGRRRQPVLRLHAGGARRSSPADSTAWSCPSC